MQYAHCVPLHCIDFTDITAGVFFWFCEHHHYFILLLLLLLLALCICYHVMVK